MIEQQAMPIQALSSILYIDISEKQFYIRIKKAYYIKSFLRRTERKKYNNQNWYKNIKHSFRTLLQLGSHLEMGSA